MGQDPELDTLSHDFLRPIVVLSLRERMLDRILKRDNSLNKPTRNFLSRSERTTEYS